MALNCRMCMSRDLFEFLDLGHIPLVDRFLTGEDLGQPEAHYPLKVLSCADCGLAQLGYIVPKELLFGDLYPYESSTTKTGKRHFFDLAKSLSDRFGFDEHDLAVDIGSNVGVLLAGFQSLRLQIVGVEPVRHLAEKANSAGLETINNFFGDDVVQQLVRSRGQASVVTATNAFAHIDDLNSFVCSLHHLLRAQGVFVIEVPYFVDLIEQCEYDTIYHEHLSYISVRALVKFFDLHQLAVFDVERVPIHGGTLRVYVGFAGQHPQSDRVDELLRLEQNVGIFSTKRLREFAEQVAANRARLTQMLLELKGQGKRLVGVSAPAKGNTLLNYCKIHTGLLDYLTEKAQAKIGLYSPGMHIPVVDDAKLIEDRPDYALLLAWNFADEIIRNLDAFRQRGGQFIIPIPTPKIL